MNIKYFKNGNFNLKLDADELQELQELTARSYTSEVAYILTLLDDIALADQCEQCASNYTMCYVFYNFYTGREYCPIYEDFCKLSQGATVKFYGHKITDQELKEDYSDYF